MSKPVIREISCRHPIPKFPYYHAKITICNESQSTYYVDKLIANRDGVRDYVIYCGADFVFEPVVKPNATTTIYARVDWGVNDEVSIEMELVEESSKQSAKISGSARTPGYGGYWNKDWDSYFSIIATERFGYERINEPIHLSTTLHLDTISDPKKEVRVVEVDPITGTHKEIPSQVYGVAPPYTGITNVSIEHSISFEVAFYANVRKNDAKVYLVFYGNKKAAAPKYPSKLSVSGTAPGLIVENEYYKISMHKTAGVLYDCEAKMGANRMLEHKIETNGSVHWNPCFYSPPTAWTHSSDWDPAPNHMVEQGPIFLMTQAYGKFPLYEDAYVSQSYVFYAETPFIRSNSIVDVQKDAYVQAIRNGEIVFNHDVITDFVYKDKLGEVKHTKIMDLPRFEEIALTYDADVPWLALYNPEDRVGFAHITLNTASMRRSGGMPRLEHDQGYLNWGPWSYTTRNMIFPFTSQNPQRMCYAPETSTYYEDIAFMPFVVRDDMDKHIKFRDVEEANQTLANKLYIQVEHKTDKRVPAQFVLGPRLEGEVKETEDKPWPITLDQNYTRFRQSPVILNETNFKEKDGKYYYR